MSNSLSNEESANQSGKTKTQKSSALNSAVVGIVVGLSAGISVSSLAFAFYSKVWLGKQWTELAAIGDFWGGHLNAFALAFLAYSLFVQTREFGLQRSALRQQIKEMEETVAVLRQDINQNACEFLLHHLQKCAEELEVIVIDTKVNTGSPKRDTYNGLNALVRGLRTRQADPAVEVVIDVFSLKAYLDLADAVAAASFELEDNISSHVTETIRTSLAPAILREYASSAMLRRESLCKHIETYKLKPETRERILQLVDRGWIIETDDTHSIATLRYETARQTRSYTSVELAAEPAKSMEEAFVRLIEFLSD